MATRAYKTNTWYEWKWQEKKKKQWETNILNISVNLCPLFDNQTKHKFQKTELQMSDYLLSQIYLPYLFLVLFRFCPIHCSLVRLSFQFQLPCLLWFPAYWHNVKEWLEWLSIWIYIFILFCLYINFFWAEKVQSSIKITRHYAVLLFIIVSEHSFCTAQNIFFVWVCVC